MKSKKEFFYFKAGKYIVGDISKLFEEKDFKKMKTSLCKLKAKGGYNKKFNIHYFRADVSEAVFTDYIDKWPSLPSETCLVIIPEESAKKGRLNNCKRFNAKNDFRLTYLHDKDGIVLYFQELDAPSPFMMLVHETQN
jgi:hypothetical protein